MRLDDIIARVSEFCSDGIFITDIELLDSLGPKILWCNGTALEMSGYERPDLIGNFLSIFQGIETDQNTLNRIGMHLSAHRPVREQILNYRKDGSTHWIDLNLCPVADQNGTAQYWIGVQRDISDLIVVREELLQTKELAKRAQKEFETSQNRLWAAIEALPEAFVIYDNEDRLVICNTQYKKVYKASASAIVVGATFESIIRHGIQNDQYPQAAGREEEWLQERLDRHNTPNGPMEQTLPGERFLQVHEVRTSTGDTVGFRSDVTELRRQKHDLELQAKALKTAKIDADIASRTDSLTGLGNRRGLDLLLEDWAQHSVPDTKIALLHLDLDRFKAINDVFGHAAGDCVLGIVSKILKDSVGKNEYVARIGGDEFTIAIRSKCAQSIAKRIAQQIITSCQVPVEFNGKVLHFSASVGIAVADNLAASGLMENADIALYDAKSSGRNRYAFFTPLLRSIAEEKKYMSDELLEGMAEDQIHPYFQPQVFADSRALFGVEALARWRHPIMGFVPPDIFLPIAKELGILGDIDDVILCKSLAMIDRLKANGYQVPKLSVNVSHPRLKETTLLERLEKLRPWPCRLAFELLETIDFDQDVDNFGWLLDQLRDLDIEIELDDFGSGKASITTLLDLRPDRIKVDRKIVGTIVLEDPGANPLVKAICEIGKALEIQMTAEGIETEVQARVVQRKGCNVLQGYLLAPALSEEELMSWINELDSLGTPVLKNIRMS